MDIPYEHDRPRRNGKATRVRKAKIHIGEAMPYKGYGKVLSFNPERVPEILEGYRHGCSCRSTTVHTVPDTEGYNMIKYPKGWIWGNEFLKMMYYL